VASRWTSPPKRSGSGTWLNINYTRLIAFLASLAIMVSLSLFLTRTDLGRAIRSTAQNRDAAALCGINVARVYNITFGLGCAIQGIIRLRHASLLPGEPVGGAGLRDPFPSSWWFWGHRQHPRLDPGGLILGVVESVAAQFVTATSASIFSFVIFILVLFFRPTGLMGMKV